MPFDTQRTEAEAKLTKLIEFVAETQINAEKRGLSFEDPAMLLEHFTEEHWSSIEAAWEDRLTHEGQLTREIARQRKVLEVVA